MYLFQDEEEGAMMNSNMSEESIKRVIDLIRNDNISNEERSDLSVYALSKGVAANLELTSDFILDYIEIEIKSGKNIGTSENPFLCEALTINPIELKYENTTTPSGQEGNFVKVYYTRLDKASPPATGYSESDSSAVSFIINESQRDRFEEYIFDEKRDITIEINRIRTDTSRTVGVIEIDNGAITGFTLELQKGTTEECCSICTDLKKADNNCHRILAGTYDCDITTYSENTNYINKSLRLENVPGRTGILIHRGVNARIWSYGCILAMRSNPINDADDASASERANTVTDSENFCTEIVSYISNRKARIREIFNITDVDVKITIKESAEIND
jgi:hypothetical protein